MDLQGAKASSGPRWAWARTSAVVLFVLTGILLIASLSQTRSLKAAAAAGPAPIASAQYWFHDD
jgi:succinate dehydrogenase hydrophobic anchor subunit